MKIKILLLTLLVFSINQAQNVNIPDTNFKNWLLNHSPVIDTNSDNEIQVSEAEAYNGVLIYLQSQAVTDFYQCEPDCQMQYEYGTPDYDDCIMMCNFNDEGIIKNLTGLEAFVNVSEINLVHLALSNQSDLTITNFNNLISFKLGFLNIDGLNYMTNIDLSNNSSLRDIYLSENEELWDLSTSYVYPTLAQVPNLITTNSSALETIQCSKMNIVNLDLSTNISLKTLDCSVNDLTSLDVTGAVNLETLNCESNDLTLLNIDSNNVKLTTLQCERNELSNLSLSNVLNLTTVYCSFNNMTNLQVTNSTNLNYINCYFNNLTSLDLSTNVNLVTLNCKNNNLTTIDFNNTANSLLEGVNCQSNSLSEIDLSNNVNLITLDADYPSITLVNSLNVIGCTSLETLICPNGEFPTLDLSSNISLTKVNVAGNNNLTYVNLKNGNNSNFGAENDFRSLPNLTDVCVDDLNTALVVEIGDDVGHTVNFSKYCSLNPKRKNEINGNVKLDVDENGCDINDIPASNILVVADNGVESYATFTQANGDYVLYTGTGSYTTSTTSNLPNYFLSIPGFYISNFVGYNNLDIVNFCLEDNMPINDVNVSLIPTSSARPGFNATYRLIYKNVGEAVLSGSVVLNFDVIKLNYLNASQVVTSQTSNSLTFDYSNLNPFETRTIDFNFNVNTPPTTNINDLLNFIATINPVTGDNTPEDNVFVLDQLVIGSYDPNDIKVLEGEEILLADASKYLNYVIRFQNTGTADAINVVVVNELDEKLDWNTLQLESTSHNSRIAIKNGNEIEFIFENINLPDNTTDEPKSHGFIAYKIKPKSNVVVGDTFSSTADIFFDFNPAIVTNTATTEIVAVLGLDDYKLSNYSVYPNPTSGVLLINSKTTIAQIEVYNYLGQAVMENTNQDTIDISKLDTGLYFVKIKDVNGDSGMEKVLKK